MLKQRLLPETFRPLVGRSPPTAPPGGDRACDVEEDKEEVISESEGCDDEGASSDDDTAKSEQSWDPVDPHYHMFDEESEEEEKPEEDEVDEDIPPVECPAGIDPLAWNAWRLEVIDHRVWRRLELWRSKARRRAKEGCSRCSCSPRRLQQLPEGEGGGVRRKRK